MSEKMINEIDLYIKQFPEKYTIAIIKIAPNNY